MQPLVIAQNLHSLLPLGAWHQPVQGHLSIRQYFSAHFSLDIGMKCHIRISLFCCRKPIQLFQVDLGKPVLTFTKVMENFPSCLPACLRLPRQRTRRSTAQLRGRILWQAFLFPGLNYALDAAAETLQHFCRPMLLRKMCPPL